MDVDVIRHLVGVACELEHRWPEQGVKIDDVLADEVNLLGVRGGEELLEAARLAVGARLAEREVVLERGEVADGGIEPDIEVLAGRVGDRDAEIGRIARDVPVAQAQLAAARKPLARLVGDLRLQAPRGSEPAPEESHASGIGQPEEEVLGSLQHRARAGEGRVWIDEIGRRVHRAAHFARIAILIRRVAVGALALDVAVRQEHALDGIVELLHRLLVHEACGLQPGVNVLRQLRVLGRVGRVPVIEAQVKTLQVLRPAGEKARDQLLWRDPFALRLEHDGCAVRVVGAHEMHLISLHALAAHPDVRLDVLHDVPDVERAIGVRQRRGDEDLPAHLLKSTGSLTVLPTRAPREPQPESFSSSNFALLMAFL